MSTHQSPRVFLIFALAGLAAAQHGEADEPAYAPTVAEASGEHLAARARIQLPEGFEVTTWASEPHLANPVAFCMDYAGRCFVAETFRLHAGVTDMRSHMNWLHDELAARTVEDRLAFMRKHEGDNYGAYAEQHERVRLVVDADGDGQADRSTVFADGFSEPASGIAAGLLARGDGLYYTCIPDLWHLRDADGDGVAEERRSLQTGYGVKIALLGHDLHGLRIGPDARLYFSIGDRGMNVEFEGKRFELPDRGAVLRCELDGSGLEVFATGLRNPQELVFDDHGNLFTGDNNSDGGDKARWVYVVRGGDTGWRHHFQYVRKPNLRGPWNAEKGWHPYHAEQPAFITPPIDNFINGPSGLTYYPGVGWGDGWRGTFFLCEFRGAPANSGIYSLRNEPKGAGFSLVDGEKFAWACLPTDCDFGPDGALYVSDWVNTWGMTGKGRMWRIAPGGLAGDEAAAAAQALLSQGFSQRDDDELARQLGHAHRDVRMEAQLELVRRAQFAEPGSYELRSAMGALVDKALLGEGFARLHALWGIGAVARLRAGELTGLDDAPIALTEDPEFEVRCQALKVLGEMPPSEASIAAARRSLAKAFDDRERFFAAQAIGALGDASDLPRLVELLDYNDDRDPWLRSACVFALERIGATVPLLQLAREHDSVPVRRALCVVLRRWEDPSLHTLLGDPSPLVVAEAARAIHDVPLVEQTEALAARLEGDLFGDWYLARRALNANRHVHDEAALARIGAFLCTPELDVRLVEEALEILSEWHEPSPVDRVHGAWRPVAGGDPGALAEVLVTVIESQAMAGWSDGAWSRYARLLRGMELRGDHPAVEALLPVLGDPAAWSGKTRRQALEALFALGHPARERLLADGIADVGGEVRAAALAELAGEDAPRAIRMLTDAIDGGDTSVRQAAVTALAAVDSELVAPVLTRLAKGEAARDGSSDIAVELIEAAEARADKELFVAVQALRARGSEAAPLSPWTSALVGGDAEAGRDVFLENAEVSCLRCHVVGDQGSSEVGPTLTDVGSRLDRRALLESIVLPNATLAEGYENWIFALDDGTLVIGRILEENDDWLVVLDSDGERHEVLHTEIEARKRDVSAMPQDLRDKLTLRELRDVVEFLAAQTGK